MPRLCQQQLLLASCSRRPIAPATQTVHPRTLLPLLTHRLQVATLADKRIVVAIDSWEADSLYPSGHYVRTLGAIGDKETETEV